MWVLRSTAGLPTAGHLTASSRSLWPRFLRHSAQVLASDASGHKPPPPPGGSASGAPSSESGGRRRRGVKGVLGAVAGAGTVASLLYYWENRNNAAVKAGQQPPAFRSLAHNKPELKIPLETDVYEVNACGVESVQSAWINANKPMEDRHSIHNLGAHGLMVAVFDGHSGTQTSDALSHFLATYVKRELDKLSGTNNRDIVHVATALSTSFEKFDTDITETVIDAAIKAKSPELLARFIPGAVNGSVATVLLVHPTGYYVATTGDCRTVLGSAMSNTRADYGATPLSMDQTGDTPSEVARLQQEHPGEQVIMRGRVLGGLQPTRAFGDARYKWSLQRLQQLQLRTRKEYRTPPYVTARPEVVYHAPHPTDRFIILASDGLWDVLPNQVAVDIAGQALAQTHTRRQMASKGDQPPSDTPSAPVSSALAHEALKAYARAYMGGDLAKLMAQEHARDSRDDITVTFVKLATARPAEDQWGKDALPSSVPVPLTEDLVTVFNRVKTQLLEKKPAAGA